MQDGAINILSKLERAPEILSRTAVLYASVIKEATSKYKSAATCRELKKELFIVFIFPAFVICLTISRMRERERERGHPPHHTAVCDIVPLCDRPDPTSGQEETDTGIPTLGNEKYSILQLNQ